MSDKSDAWHAVRLRLFAEMLRALLLCLLRPATGQDECLAAFSSEVVCLRDLSAVMTQDHNWDILHRRGEPTVCVREGHRFFFVLFFYQHWQTLPATSDFCACLPRECDTTVLSDEVLPKMYQHFFDHHSLVLPDGSIDEAKSLQYSMTLKEYKSGVDLSADLHWPVFLGVAVMVLPGLIAALWDLISACRGRRASYFLLDTFSLQRGWWELSSAEGFSADLCWVRVAYVVALITLHVTQGSKWRYIEVLESTYLLFAAVRPLALVQDAFFQLSAYLCACSDAKVQASSRLQRLRLALIRSWHKYLRQLPVCLCWNWFYLFVLPAVSWWCDLEPLFV